MKGERANRAAGEVWYGRERPSRDVGQKAGPFGLAHLGWPIGLRADGALGRDVIDDDVDQAVVADEISRLTEGIAAAGDGIA